MKPKSSILAKLVKPRRDEQEFLAFVRAVQADRSFPDPVKHPGKIKL